MNERNNKKSKKPVMILFIVLIIVFFACACYLIVDLIISKLKNGWTANDTIYLVFSCVMATVIVSTFPPLSDYYIDRDKGVVFSRNNLYKAINNLDSLNILEEYRLSILSEQREKYITKMNKILDKKKINHDIITKNNIDSMFSLNSKKSIFNMEIAFTTESRLVGLLIKYEKEICPKFDSLYRLYKSGDLLRQRSFPLQNLVLPFLFSLVSVFVVIYQALSTDNTIDISIWEYLKIIGSGAFVGVAYSILRISPTSEAIVKDNEKNTQEIINFSRNFNN